MSRLGHRPSNSTSQNQRAALANAYNELGKELSSAKIRVVGNYTLGKVIGEGTYGKVRLGTHRLTSTRVAIKQIPKAMSASLTREIHHHRQLHHPHVTQMYEVIATESSIWIVTELCHGGELFDYLVEKGRLAEDEAKSLFGQLCLAVGYLHEKGIVHRDLKLENVLLDERCRVKLGDFGFTREWEKGAWMETFCGTTGYAAPEVLQCKKYQGPEVDVWSLGIILYVLLTGALPFDDDDESIMKDMIIDGRFEDPEWLSVESRDLIKSILQPNPQDRLTIPQILSHKWYTSPTASYSEIGAQMEPPMIVPSRAPSPELAESSETSASSSTMWAKTSGSSAPTTPERDTFGEDVKTPQIHSNPSQTTIRTPPKNAAVPPSPNTVPETVPEEGDEITPSRPPPPRRTKSSGSTSTQSKMPAVHTVRTPARTKRRSVSSQLSADANESTDNLSAAGGGPPSAAIPTTPLPPLPGSAQHEIDFAGLLSTKAPLIFSTERERELLNSLSALGLDTGQIVHSVLSDACDAAGAMWWMLLRKAEARTLDADKDKDKESEKEYVRRSSVDVEVAEAVKKQRMRNTGVQTDISKTLPPQLSFVPPTPTVATHSVAAVGIARPVTPPTISRGSATNTPMLTPSSSTLENTSSQLGVRSQPGTPGSSSGKSRKGRSGSVSIMQRATTALEAAGLVRKKSSEAINKELAGAFGQGLGLGTSVSSTASIITNVPERKSSLPLEDRDGIPSPRSSGAGAGGHNKLTKSPPLRPSAGPSTPPNLSFSEEAMGGSPWVFATSAGPSVSDHGHGQSPTSSKTPPLGQHPPNLGSSLSSPSLAGDATITRRNAGQQGAAGGQRNRANLLATFRLWFGEGGDKKEDKKGKRKAGNAAGAGGIDGMPGSKPVIGGRSVSGSSSKSGNQAGGAGGSVKRRTSGSGSRFTVGSRYRRAGHSHRPSVSSRRSSSVNSRRSSITSVQMVVLDSPAQPVSAPAPHGRRSIGNQTPNSDRGEYISSRPSSVRSFQMHGGSTSRHRKSPSASSASSAQFRTQSPMQQRHHRRAGSGNSATTRVVRTTSHQTGGGSGSSNNNTVKHGRSNSATSSLHSPTSSRRNSWYGSDGEGSGPIVAHGHGRSASPVKSPANGRKAASSFVAQKRIAPFMSPSGSLGRSSWKKSWGLEPPGWQTRTAQAGLPVEVLSVSPADNSTNIRDVFSSSKAGGAGAAVGGKDEDEDDWIDEEDELGFAGGLGQMGTSGSSGNAFFESGSSNSQNMEGSVLLSPAPRGHNKRSGRKANGVGTTPSVSGRKQDKPGHSPANQNKALPSEPFEGPSSRRQLPIGRPAFRNAIVEEEEEEEE